MDLPDGTVLAAVLTGIAGIITAAFVGVNGVIKLKNAHQLAMEKLRGERYLVDYEEVEDLRWWRRAAIKVVNAFLDDYATRSIEPPVDALAELVYPPKERPRTTPKGRLE